MNELRLINDFFDFEPMDSAMRGLMRPLRFDALERSAPQLRIDLTEDDGAYSLKAEIPGVAKDDIDVRVDGKLLTISAEVKQDKEERKDGRVLRSERRYGYASRSFTLDSAVDESKAEAQYRDGVLKMRLPKKSGGGNGKKLAIAG
jgi:HSP20 family protein